MLSEKYAQALYHITKDKSEKDQKRFFDNFIKVLKRDGHFSLLPKILKSLREIYLKEYKKDNIDLIVSDEKFKDKYKKEIKNYKKYIDLNQEITTKVDNAIVGGFIIHTKDVVVDGSYRRGLVNLYNKFIG